MNRNRLPNDVIQLVQILSVAVIICANRCSAWSADIPQIDPATAGVEIKTLEKIDSLIAESISQNKMPGCVVLVGRPAGIVSLKAYGNKRLQPDQEAMSIDTVFDLASVTKPIATATSIMQLVQAHKVLLDETVQTYIPEFAVEGKETITIRDLMVHRSGLIPDNSIADYADGPVKAKERLFGLKLSAPIGLKFIYSDVNFMILGEVVERVSGQRLNEFAGQRIFEPLEMRETHYLLSDSLRQRAAPTELREGRWMQGEVHDPRAFKLGGVAGHAGLFGTARDLARYAADAIAGINDDNSKVLSQETWSKMTTPHKIIGLDSKGNPTTDIRGLGWDMQSRFSSNRGTSFSNRAFGHGGFTGNAVWIDPERRIYSVFLSNRVHPNGRGLVNPLIGKINDIVVESIAN